MAESLKNGGSRDTAGEGATTVARLRNRSLPYDQWPIEDRHRWASAYGNTDIFDKHSRAHLAPATVTTLQVAYGLALNFVADRHPDLLALHPDVRFTRDLVMDYVSYTRRNCRDTTVTTRIARLAQVLTAFHPGLDWSWLRAVSRRIAHQAQPLQHRQVSADALFGLGIDLMERATALAETDRLVTVELGELFRDGLLIALLVSSPLRRDSMAKLQIGSHIYQIGSQWCLDVPAEETKNRLALQYDLLPLLSKYLGVYLTRFRSAFPGATDHQGLWPSALGRPFSGQGLYHRVMLHTARHFGFGVPLQQFRRASATFWSVEDPKNVRGTKDLLGHTSFKTTERYYIQAQSRLAGRVYSSVLDMHLKSDV